MGEPSHQPSTINSLVKTVLLILHDVFTRPPVGLKHYCVQCRLQSGTCVPNKTFDCRNQCIVCRRNFCRQTFSCNLFIHLCFSRSHLHSLRLHYDYTTLPRSSNAICRQTSSVSLRSSSRMRSASSSSSCMTAYSRDAPQKLRFGGEIRQRRTRRARKRPQASSRLIASIVSSLCGIAIVSTPPFLLSQWGLSLYPLLPRTILLANSSAIPSIVFASSDFGLRRAIVSLRRIAIKWRSCITSSTNDFPYAASPTFTPDAPRGLKSRQGSLNRARRHIRDLCNLCRRHLNIAAQAIQDDLLKICVLSNCLTVIITDITDRITDITDRITDRRWGTLRITTLGPPPEHNLEEPGLLRDGRRRQPRCRTCGEIARDATAPRLGFLLFLCGLLLRRRAFFCSLLDELALNGGMEDAVHQFLWCHLPTSIRTFLPLSVNRYFCVGERGESGCVISTRPSSIAGERYFSRKLRRPPSLSAIIMSNTDISPFSTFKSRTTPFGSASATCSPTCSLTCSLGEGTSDSG